MHESKDRLFPVPTWWMFNFLPNSDVIAAVFEAIFQSGLYGRWTGVFGNLVKGYRVSLQKASLDSLMASGRFKLVTSFEGTLADSMIRESFWLLVYCLTLASLLFALELYVGGKWACVSINL